MELHRRRKALTEPEVRYFLKQTLLAVKYLHDNKVKCDATKKKKDDEAMQCYFINCNDVMTANKPRGILYCFSMQLAA